MNEEEQTSEETKHCAACKRSIPADAETCPHCGADQPTVQPDILKTAHD